MSDLNGLGSDASSDLVKRCCAAAYETEAARWLLGESFHPGGLALTERLGRMLKLEPGMRTLDLACGRGTSGLFIADRFGCDVVGIDLSEHNIEHARSAARSRGLAGKASFEQCDVEIAPFPDGSFDAVICECSFCLFPDKTAAAREIARLLRAEGRLGLSDLIRSQALPAELRSLTSWAACIADAQPLEALIEIFTAAGLTLGIVERHDDALIALVDEIRRRLFGAEILAGLQKISWPDFDFRVAKEVVRDVREAARRGVLGYAIATVEKSASAR